MLRRRSMYSVRSEDVSRDSGTSRGDLQNPLQSRRDLDLNAAEIIETRANLPRQLGFGSTVRRAHVGLE